MQLLLYYDSLTFTSSTDTPSMDMVAFLGNIGGTLGLLLGISLLSVCETIHVLIETGFLLKQRLQNKHNTASVPLTENMIRFWAIGLKKLCHFNYFQYKYIFIFYIFFIHIIHTGHGSRSFNKKTYLQARNFIFRRKSALVTGWMIHF